MGLCGFGKEESSRKWEIVKLEAAFGKPILIG